MEPTPDPVITTPEPAQTPTVSATRAAAEKQDFSTFQDAHLANRQGKPLPAVTVEPAKVPSITPGTDTALPAERGIENAKQRREREADDRLRSRVQEAVSVKDAEIAHLKAQLTRHVGVEPPPAVRPQPVHVAPEPEPDASDTTKYPGGEYDPKYLRDVAKWDVKQELRQRAESDAQRAHQGELTAAQQARVDAFRQRTTVADPAFLSKLSEEVKALRPVSALMVGEPSGPLNILTEQIFDSPVAPAILLHLSEHPEELEKFHSMPPHIAAMPPAVRTGAHIQWIVREFGKLEARLEPTLTPAAPPPAAVDTVSKAAPPPPSLNRPGATTDPAAAALKRGDFEAFNAIHIAQERKRRGWA